MIHVMSAAINDTQKQRIANAVTVLQEIRSTPDRDIPADLWERAAYASLAGTAGETVDGGRTVEALGLADERARRIDDTLADAYRSERFTLRLRTIWFPTVDVAYVLPVVAALAWGGWLVSADLATIGEVTTVVLYIQQLADPVDRLL